MYANTKLAEVEREKATLQAKAKEQREVIAELGSKLEVLSQQKVACEEQNRSLAKEKKKLEAFNNHLEQKVIGQQASIQNFMQVHAYVHVSIAVVLIVVFKFMMLGRQFTCRYM